MLRVKSSLQLSGSMLSAWECLHLLLDRQYCDESEKLKINGGEKRKVKEKNTVVAWAELAGFMNGVICHSRNPLSSGRTPLCTPNLKSLQNFSYSVFSISAPRP